MNIKEIECARLAWAAKVDVAKERLETVRSIKFENPLAGFRPWPTEYQGIKQLALLPAMWIVLFLFALTIPLIFIVYCVDKYMQVIELHRKINQPFDPAGFPEPEEKTLGALWGACGLSDKLGAERSADLLHKWIVILYGQQWADFINVKEESKNTIRRQFKINLSNYNSESRTHFYFAPAIRTIIQRLTNTLPPYAEKD